MPGDYVVRGGESVLVKREGDPAAAWIHLTRRRPIQLSSSELVSSPAADPQLRWWTFSRGGWLLSVRDHQFFKKPMGESLNTRGGAHKYLSSHESKEGAEMKLTESQLRRLIRTETKRVLGESRVPRKSLVSLLFEEQGAAEEKKEKKGVSDVSALTLGGKPLGEPKGEKFTAQTNFADFKDAESCREVFAQLATGDGNQPIYKAMEFTDKNKETGEESVKKPNVQQIVTWLKGFGPELDELANRIVLVGSKLPKTGIAKDKMPFLPGPPDAAGTVDQVQDALEPGGEFNVDFKESRRRSGQTFLVERWQRLAGLREVVEPPAPNTFVGMKNDAAQKFMKSGLEDGKPDDDKAQFVKDPSIAAADAIPTQKNVLLPKTISMAASGVKGGNLGAYFSTKNEILDGHHRWSATMLNDPSANIGGFAAVDLEAMGGREKALQYLTAIGNALGNRTKTS